MKKPIVRVGLDSVSKKAIKDKLAKRRLQGKIFERFCGILTPTGTKKRLFVWKEQK